MVIFSFKKIINIFILFLFFSLIEDTINIIKILFILNQN